MSIAVANLPAQREFAQEAHVFQIALETHKLCVTLVTKALRSSKRGVRYTLYRYPSLYRSACLSGRPISFLRANPRAKRLAIGYQREVASLWSTGRAKRAQAHPTTIGREQCKRHPSSLQQWQYSAWPGASTMTSNAAWPAQAQALSRLNCLAPTKPAPWLSVLLLAYSATTQAFAANLKTIAPVGRATFGNRRGAARLTAVFRFGD